MPDFAKRGEQQQASGNDQAAPETDGNSLQKMRMLLVRFRQQLKNKPDADGVKPKGAEAAPDAAGGGGDAAGQAEDMEAAAQAPGAAQAAPASPEDEQKALADAPSIVKDTAAQLPADANAEAEVVANAQEQEAQGAPAAAGEAQAAGPEEQAAGPEEQAAGPEEQAAGPEAQGAGPEEQGAAPAGAGPEEQAAGPEAQADPDQTEQFEKAGDAQHDPDNADGKDFRNKGGVEGKVDRETSYGNFAGKGNRILLENPEARAKKEADPHYDETKDPKYANDPRYKPVDGMDAAAEEHDSDYTKADKGNGMFSWEGMKDFHDADKKLAGSVDKEMDEHGDQYSKGAQQYSKGLRGFFGGRVMGEDAVEGVESKAGAAEAGIKGFAKGAGQWHSVGDAEKGLEKGAGQAGKFVEQTAEDAKGGLAADAKELGKLGAVGALGAAGGLGDVALAGAAHEANEGVKWLENKLPQMK